MHSSTVKVPFFNSFNVFSLKLILSDHDPPGFLSFEMTREETTVGLRASSYCGTASCMYPCSITIVSGKTSIYFVGLNSLLFLLKKQYAFPFIIFPGWLPRRGKCWIYTAMFKFMFKFPSKVSDNIPDPHHRVLNTSSRDSTTPFLPLPFYPLQTIAKETFY